MKDLRGNRLIYLVSQPRAGSTLLQRILGCHPEIQTASEPWLMFHSIFALRSTGYQADFDQRYATIALKEFLTSLPNGEEAYYESVRLASWSLYSKCLEASGARYFLDKTPRYYFILPELYRVFPEAQFILLIRNPLAVLTSIYRTWVRSDICRMREYRHDLLEAPRRLADGIRRLNGQAVVVHYERLVESPDRTVASVCQKLGLEFHPMMVDYGRHDAPKWRLGDPRTVYDTCRPLAHNRDAWQEHLADPQIWRFASDYLQRLEAGTLSMLGYDRAELGRILADHAPGRRRSLAVASLDDVLADVPSVSSVARLRHRWRCFRDRIRRPFQRLRSRSLPV
jgi:hypothetical protein